MVNYILAYKYSIIFAVVILIGCAISSPPDVFNAINVNVVVYEDVKTQEVVWLCSFQDTIAHIGLYFCLTLLFIWEYRKKNCIDIVHWKHFLILVGVPLMYGVIVEFLQEIFFPPRSAEILDVVADLFGCLVAYLLSMCYFCIQNRVVIKN